jgi:hypothetical protein
MKIASAPRPRLDSIILSTRHAHGSNGEDFLRGYILNTMLRQRLKARRDAVLEVV